jgi:hypothetical protein
MGPGTRSKNAISSDPRAPHSMGAVREPFFLRHTHKSGSVWAREQTPIPTSINTSFESI